MPSPQLAVLVDMLRSAPPVPQDMDTASAPTAHGGADRRRRRSPTACARRRWMRAACPASGSRPTGASPRGTILYLHGGGYTIGSVRTHRGLVGRLALATGARGLTRRLPARAGASVPGGGRRRGRRPIAGSCAAARLRRRSSSPATRPAAASRWRTLVALRDAGERAARGRRLHLAVGRPGAVRASR